MKSRSAPDTALQSLPSKAPSPNPVPTSAPTPAKLEPLFVRMAAPGASLSHISSPTDRVAALSGMASEVRLEAMRIVEIGPTGDMPRLARLHDLLLRRGVVGRLTIVPPVEKKILTEKLIRDLRDEDTKIKAAQGGSPDELATLLRPFRESLGAAITEIEGGKWTPSTLDDEAPTSLEAFALLAIQLSEADGTLRRADLSLAMAKSLASATVLVMVDANGDSLEKMGGYIDEVMAQGVDENLRRAQVDDPDGKLRGSITGIREKSGQAIAVLERNLEKAPSQAKKGLERAIEASRPGSERAAKGKGPPWKRPDGAWIPPGLKKKM